MREKLITEKIVDSVSEWFREWNAISDRDLEEQEDDMDWMGRE